MAPLEKTMTSMASLQAVSRPVMAALDLGTNNCRLLVAHAQGKNFTVVDSFSRIVRLGEGVEDSGHLSEAAVERTLAALSICADKMRRARVAFSRCVATEACRRAANGPGFLERVQRETGLFLEAIPAEEEARLALSGCVPLFDHSKSHVLMFDIGGGSTELMWHRVDAPVREGAVAWTSLPFGVVTLSERFSGAQSSKDLFHGVRDYVRDHLAPFEAEHGICERIAAGDVQMLGTSGTVTTLAAVHMDLPRYDRSRVDGAHLGIDDVAATSRRLSEMGLDGREAIPSVGKDRADLVVAGCAILEAICALWPVDGLTVADRGLREGILNDLAVASPPLRGAAS